MDTNGHQSPERIRAGLSHPIIDADGHWLEFITRDDFRDFTFANAVRLWGTGNPSFFAGPAVAKAAAALLAETPAGVGR